MENYADILFINEVKALQEQAGSAERYQQLYSQRTKATLDASDLSFIANCESFYIASISSTGWPYVQHRGGPKGFLKAIDANQLGFVDYPGNRQFITMGHAQHESKVALFIMDYEQRTRLKMLGHLSMQHADQADTKLCKLLSVDGQPKMERIATIDIVAVDWNCPKYIPQRMNKEKIDAYIDSQLTELEAENNLLREQVRKLEGA